MEKEKQKHGGELARWGKGNKPAKAVKTKGSESFKTIARRYLAALSKGEDPFTGQSGTVNNSTRLFFTLANIAINGEKDADKIAAIREILDRIEGKTKQADGEPVTQIENQQINIFLDGKKIDLSK